MSENERYERIIAAIKAKAREILPLGSKVSLYGSRARGDSQMDSDWDIHILIPGDEKLHWSFWDSYAWPFAELGFSFDEVINPRLYSFSGWMKRRFLPFYKNVERDSILIFEN